VTPGEPRVVDIPAIAEKSLGGREPVRTLPIGCSGASNAQLILLRDSMPTTTHADQDEMLYVVAGEATLRLGEKDQRITPGWFSVVPRGTPYALTRRGSTQVILLSIVGGQACGQLTSPAQR
jgi:mannose-6-phosphate isomerase-like protein (cupin superfamily)